MAKGKMRIGYAIMTVKGALLTDLTDNRYSIYQRRMDATKARMKIGIRGLEIVRVTIDTDN